MSPVRLLGRRLGSNPTPQLDARRRSALCADALYIPRPFYQLERLTSTLLYAAAAPSLHSGTEQGVLRHSVTKLVPWRFVRVCRSHTVRGLYAKHRELHRGACGEVRRGASGAEGCINKGAGRGGRRAGAREQRTRCSAVPLYREAPCFWDAGWWCHVAP